MLAPWHEGPWLFFYLTTISLFIVKRPHIALVSLFVAGLVQWQWSLLLFIFYVSLLLFKSNSQGQLNFSLFPPGLRSKAGAFKIAIVTLLPSLLTFLQQSLFKYNAHGLTSAGSGILYRIGIDSANNIHHGGIVASLQFLGGNRLSLCVNDSFDKLASNISSFNCFASISGVFLLSFISIIGFLFLSLRQKDFRWISIPTAWSFLSFCFIFQQSFAAHLQGYSFVFAFLFVQGLIFIMALTKSIYSSSSDIALIFYSPIIAGILINFLRVSYITGVNG